MARYIPPVQSKIGQIIDVIVLVILSIGALLHPALAGSCRIEQGADAGGKPDLGKPWARTR